ncbi:GNAT family N-acetyltransferase [Pseudomonas sp.]|uniref:GNAT family N-acetyltransferase n=1 Tax=Pseudomonas sp. TaxID=306 RepID=UPI00272CF0FB|nr:GNAT family N-acetyltransferase [Pseudomonas sp.]
MLSIREAGLPDLDKVAELFDQYRCFYEQSSDLALAKRFIGDRMANNESVILVAEGEGGELAGFTQLYPSFSSISAAPSYILNDLYVAVAYRRQGLGRALLEGASKLASSKGAVALELSTAEDNRNAQALYESLGWVRDQQFRHYELTIEKADE